MKGFGSIGSLLGLASADPDAITLVIEGKRFLGWTQLELNFALDNVSTISFAAPFEPDSKDFRAVFRPFSFKGAEVYVGDELIFTGTLVGVAPSTDLTSSTVSVSGYSLPGVLQDCTMPAAAWPLEFVKMDLRQVAEKCCKPFGLEVAFSGPWTGQLGKVALEPDQKVWDFLVDPAKQKGFVLSSTNEGHLLFQRSKSGKPIAAFRDDERPCQTVSVSFDPQNFFSSITALGTKKTHNKGSNYTIGNDFLPDAVRPHTVKLEDTETGDIADAAKAKLGRMLGNAVSYTVEVPTWRDPSGELWATNETVKLYAPGAMVYSETELLIRSVALRANPGEMNGTLGLVLPGSFSGEMPKSMPWDEPGLNLLNAIKAVL